MESCSTGDPTRHRALRNSVGACTTSYGRSADRGGEPFMSSSQSVTQWLKQFMEGDQEAAERLWERYFAQLVKLARGKLRGARRRDQDEEDVALNALHSFFRGAAEGRF